MRVLTHVEQASTTPARRWLWLCSDAHIGSAHSRMDLLQREIEKAKRLDALCLVNGDLLDLILPKDSKRYEPGALAPRLRNSPTPMNEALDWAYELLEPIAPNLMLIGMGNHEGSVEKWHSFDPISVLVQRLQTVGSPVVHGGYAGYFRLRFQFPGVGRGGTRATLTLRYHHGAGGSAPITKGIIDLGRMASWASDADIIWIGHKHNQLHVPGRRERVSDSGTVSWHDYHTVMSGGYLDVLCGDHASYSEKANLPPQPTGGVFLECLVERRGDARVARVGEVGFGA